MQQQWAAPSSTAAGAASAPPPGLSLGLLKEEGSEIELPQHHAFSCPQRRTTLDR